MLLFLENLKIMRGNNADKPNNEGSKIALKLSNLWLEFWSEPHRETWQHNRNVRASYGRIFIFCYNWFLIIQYWNTRKNLFILYENLAVTGNDSYLFFLT